MKKSAFALLILTMFGAVLVSGCTSDDNSSATGMAAFDNRRNNSFEGGRMPWGERAGNFSEEEMRQMFEERQKNAIDACAGKNADDKCLIETPAGESEGTCIMMNEALICMSDAMRQRPERMGGGFPQE